MHPPHRPTWLCMGRQGSYAHRKCSIIVVASLKLSLLNSRSVCWVKIANHRLENCFKTPVIASPVLYCQDVGNTIADFSGDLDMREVFEEEFNQKFATRTHFLPSDRISGHWKIWDTIWSIPWTSQTVRYDLTHKKPQSFVAKSTNFCTFFVF